MTSTDPRWMDPAPHPYHHASTGPLVCGWCPGWRDMRCVEPGCPTFDGEYHLPVVYHCDDGLLRCWTHRALGQQMEMWAA